RYVWIGQEVVEADGTPLLEKHCHPEGRERVHEERDQRDSVVEAGVLAKSGDDANQHTDDDCRHGREGDELDRLPHRVTKHRGDFLVGLVVLAEVALNGGAQPVEVSNERIDIQVQQLSALLDEVVPVGLAGSAKVFKRVASVSRKDEEEISRRQEHANGGDHTARNEPKHVVSDVRDGVRPPPCGGGLTPSMTCRSTTS